MNLSILADNKTQRPTRNIVNMSYWAITIIFAIFMVVSAIGELMQVPDIINSLTALQIPLYYLTLLGVLKLLGVVAILIPGFPRLKEWAYAGFTFDFMGAIYALIVVQPPFISDYIFAPLAMLLCLGSYVLYRRRYAG